MSEVAVGAIASNITQDVAFERHPESTRAVFRCQIPGTELASAAAVFLSKHCSSFCFLVQKNVQKLIN
jgi:hypothetical protein